MHTLRNLLWAVSLSVATPLVLGAQNAEVRGVVINAETRQPMAGVTILLRPTGVLQMDTASRVQILTSDEQGQFLFSKLMTGPYFIEAIAPGHASPLHRIELTKNDKLEVEFEVGERVTPVLPELEVTADAAEAARVAEFLRPFYERMSRGLGRFLTKDDLVSMQDRTLFNALRTVQGLDVRCRGGTRDCTIHLSGSNMRCGAPSVVLDGMLAGPDVLGALAVDQIEGIEVHRMSTAPAEYRTTQPECGVILIWTKRGPPVDRPGTGGTQPPAPS